MLIALSTWILNPAIDLFRVEVTWSAMGKQYKKKMASQSGVSARGERKDLNWTKNLHPLPRFTTEQLHNHLDGGKKDIGSKG